MLVPIILEKDYSVNPQYLKNGLVATATIPITGSYYSCAWGAYVSNRFLYVYSEAQSHQQTNLLGPILDDYSIDSAQVSTALMLKGISSLAISLINKTDLSDESKNKLETSINCLGLGITTAAAVGNLVTLSSFKAPAALQLTALYTCVAASFFRSL